MIVDMHGEQHLWVQFDPRDDKREVIIDKAANDVRICDGKAIVKLCFKDQQIQSVLVDDIFVWP